MLLATDTLTPVGIALTIFGILSSSGALAWWWRSGTKVSMADRTATEANNKADVTTPKVASLETQVTQVSAIASQALAKAEAHETRLTALQTQVTEHGAIIQEIRLRIAKLDRVDEIVGAVNSMRDVVNKTVPRDEVTLQRENDANRFHRVEEDIRTLAHKASEG